MVGTRVAAPLANRNGSGSHRKFTRSSGPIQLAFGALIYGTGGIGKTSLSAMAPSPLIIDLERGTHHLNCNRIDDVQSWADLRACVQDPSVLEDVKTLVIDSGTAAEELCRKHVIENVRTEKGGTVTSLEGFGWGKGYTFLFEEWRRLLSDLDKVRAGGRNVILICHEQIGKVPNPSGEDYIRFQPRLYHSSNASLLSPTKEWCDHVLFVSYDVAARDGKAKGSGTRTIYTVEQATYMAKTRTLGAESIVFSEGSDDVWRKMFAAPVAAPADDMPPV